MLEERIQTILTTRGQQANYRKRHLHQSPENLSFCSNDYLGLKNHPKVISAVKIAVDRFGVGSGSAYLLTGYHRAHQALEDELADFLNFPSVLLLSSGYMANVGLVSALVKKQDSIYADKLVHASLIDGCLLSKAKFCRYAHANLNCLNNLLTTAQTGQKWIISEGLFGMDGTIVSLQELCKISRVHDCQLFLDDAHGIGVLGEQGRGCIEYADVKQSDITILVGTLSKAFGSYGSFVACSKSIREALIQTMRTYMFTTALPPLLAEASRASLKIIREQPERRFKLQALIKRFQKSAEQLNIPLMHTNPTPMQLVFCGDNKRAHNISAQLSEFGLLIKPILPPTVPKNTARLRISLTAMHAEQHIDYLVEKLAYVINNLN